MTVSDRSVYVYIFAVPSGAVKIGIARNVAQRLNDLQVGNHEPLSCIYRLRCADINQARALEALLHRRYARDRLRGEWFLLDIPQFERDLKFALSVAAIMR